MSQGQLARCPYCQQGTLITGYYCAFCGRMLRQPPQAQQAPPQQAYQPQQGYPPQQAYQQAPPQQQYSQAPQSGRPALVCAYCQTPNEPWLNNCKSCQRPLASTR